MDGIIKGLGDGNFKPNTPVSRQDMAVMIDRAMQLKGSYTRSKALDFNDKAKVGARSAKTSVERLYHYNVMGAFNGKNYEATTIGTRAETAKFIYNMLTVLEGKTIATPPVTSNLTVEQIKKKHPFDLTHAEIVKAYGPYVILRRNDVVGDKGIFEWDIWEDNYLRYIKNAKAYKESKVQRPDEWLKDFEETVLTTEFQKKSINYPNFELIAVNGKPFLASNLMRGKNLDFFNWSNQQYGYMFPTPPSNVSQFKIDLIFNKQNFAVYEKERVTMREYECFTVQ